MRVHKGKLNIVSLMDNKDITVQADGHIGIEKGDLDLPLEIEFSGTLADQLQERSSFFKYLANKNGNPALNLKLTGTVTSPKATLDTVAVEKQFKNKVVEELGKKLLETQSPDNDTSLGDPTEQIDDILKKNEKSINLLKDFFGN